MRCFPYQVFTAAVLLSAFFNSAGAADDSPTGYFAAHDAENAKKNAAILAATTPEELMELDVLPCSRKEPPKKEPR